MGGKEALRGFLYQGISSVLEALADKKSWDKIYVEYPTTGDKVDIALEEKGEIVKCIQVKSTINIFAQADIKRWITDLVKDCKSSEYEIFLIGQCDRGTQKFINSIKKYSTNQLDQEAKVSLKNFDTSLLDNKRIYCSVLPFDSEILKQILRDSLHKYISYKKYKVAFEQIDLIALAMVEDQMFFSECGRGIERTEFDEILEKRLSLTNGRDLPERISIAVISFANGAAELEEETERCLSFLHMFKQRELKDEYSWNDDIYMELDEFLLENTNNKAAYQLYLTKTHSSIAFAAGRILNTKSGINIFPVQNTSTNGVMLWDVKPGKRTDYCNWIVKNEQLQAEQVDSALILNITRDIKKDVIKFIKDKNLPIGRIISCIPEEMGSTNFSIKDGTHASLLANDVYKAINARSDSERHAVMHIFAAAPNAFMFFLGQNSIGFGKCILYEYDFEQRNSCTYSKSISFDEPAIRYLTILEISQKQAYIFTSNKLKDNAANSAKIAWIMNPEYFNETINDESVFSLENNVVYSGGGHTVLEFASPEQAREFTKRITYNIHKNNSGIEVFATTIPYREITPEGKPMTPGDNLRKLTKELEKKKSIRRTAFHQGSFAIEKIDATTLSPVPAGGFPVPIMPKHEKDFDAKVLSGHYESAKLFEDLGGDTDNSNFIAVVHIDGNSMGRRMEELYEECRDKEWGEFKKIVGNCSKNIDDHYKEAYIDMTDCVKKNIELGKLDALKLKKDNKENIYFPVRRVITAGDDICFVTEGRIGLECAVKFLKALGQKKNSDGKGYAACAGVAIVHQKYPFFRAYELAELLCKNAKKLGVSIDADFGNMVSAIDWHIEYGEIGNSIKEIRKKYQTKDGKRLEMRPYIVCAPEAINEREPKRQYENFKTLVKRLSSHDDSYARGKIMELRAALKQGESQARHFLKFNKIETLILESYYGIFSEMDYSRVFTGQEMEKPIFVKTFDEEYRSFLFDAIEIMDTYIELED